MLLSHVLLEPRTSSLPASAPFPMFSSSVVLPVLGGSAPAPLVTSVPSVLAAPGKVKNRRYISLTWNTLYHLLACIMVAQMVLVTPCPEGPEFVAWKEAGNITISQVVKLGCPARKW